MDIKLMPEQYQKGHQPKSSLKSSVADFKQLGDQAVSRGNLWLTISIGILLIAGSVYLGLWVYQRQLNQEKQELIVKVDELQAQRDLELEADFTKLKKGIENLKKILKKRIYPSLVFKMLEELTLPQVQFSGFDGKPVIAFLIEEEFIMDPLIQLGSSGVYHLDLKSLLKESHPCLYMDILLF